MKVFYVIYINRPVTKNHKVILMHNPKPNHEGSNNKEPLKDIPDKSCKQTLDAP